jgi:DNA-binding response OmpR family regulator
MLLKKIVVAEDDDAIAHLIAARSGTQASVPARPRRRRGDLPGRREAPDLLILDVMMPHTDGLEVAKRLKSDVLASRIPILMLTSLSAVDDRVKGLEAGADDYLGKPFDLRELTRASGPSSGRPSASAIATRRRTCPARRRSRIT